MCMYRHFFQALRPVHQMQSHTGQPVAAYRDRNELLGWGWGRQETLVNDDSAYPKAFNSQGEFFKHRVQKGRPDNSETVHMWHNRLEKKAKFQKGQYG